MGINGVALGWLKSYLSNRCQYVAFDGITSDFQDITTGVPQGSILGPLLFLIYIYDMYIATKTSITFHFADDTYLLNSDKLKRSSATVRDKKKEKSFKCKKL